MYHLKNFANYSVKIFSPKYTKLPDITIEIDDPEIKKSAGLNPNDKLSDIREKLRKKGIDGIDTLSFARRSNNGISSLTRDEEDNKILEEIIYKEGSDKILYLRKDSEPDWNYFNNKNKLDYGRTIVNGEFKEAKKSAFTIGECEKVKIDKIVENNKEVKSYEDLMTMKNLFLAADSNIQEYLEFGSSIENSKIRKCNFAENSTYHMCEYNKVSLKLKKLKPTEEFINAVEDAIKSKNPRKFKEITDKFGQFIPTKVILGGRAVYNESDVLKESVEVDADEGTGNVGFQNSKLTIGKRFSRLLRKKKYFKSEDFELVGGKQSNAKDFEKKDWVKSLDDDYRNWSCIKFKEPISIFKPLPKSLRKKILSLSGKKIHYSTIEAFNYKLKDFVQSEEFELKIPDKIKIFANEEADWNIFATVIDTERIKKDFFHCQILWPYGEYPRLIVHCIQKSQHFRRRECNLKIGWMIVGNDINFNFNRQNFNTRLEVQNYNFTTSNSRTQTVKYLLTKYGKEVSFIGIPVLRNSSDKHFVIGHHFFNDQENRNIGTYIFSYNHEKKHYDNLPDFTFCTLVIQNHPKSGLLRFKRTNMIRTFFIKPKPKYISLCSKRGDICGPVFLKQKVGEIKKKYIDITDDKCYINNCICKNTSLKQSEKDLKFVYFAPKTDI